MCNAYNHPPGCTCGWGGEGHLGTSYGGALIEATPTSYWSGVTREWRDREFTRPTKCPECGANVFFIRHNGGCVWIDPPLGPPWDKHPCFDKPLEPTHSFSKWTLKSSGLRNPQLGVVKRIDGSRSSAEPTIHIQLTNSTRVSLVLRWTPSDPDFLGSLVIISEEDNLLLHPTYAEIPFHSFSRTEPVVGHGWYRCDRCKAHVRHGTGHEEHCRKHYGSRPASKPPAPVFTPNNTKTPPPNATPQKGSSLSQQPPQKLPHPPEHKKPHPQLVAAAKAQNVRIQDEVHRIAKEAWEAGVMAPSPEARLKAAKQHALRLIAALSPSLRREVDHRFTSTKWAPLSVFSAPSPGSDAEVLRPTPLNWPLPSSPE